jgi:hypothetical protein
MKKIALIMVLGLTTLTGCCSGHDVEPTQSSAANKYIDLVVIYENLSQQTEVMYDKNTGAICRDNYSSDSGWQKSENDGTVEYLPQSWEETK